MRKDKDKDTLAELEAELEQLRPIAAAAIELRRFWATAGGGTSHHEMVLIAAVDSTVTDADHHNLHAHAEGLRARIASRRDPREPA